MEFYYGHMRMRCGGGGRISAHIMILDQGREMVSVKNLQVKCSLWFTSLNSMYHSIFKRLLHKEYKPLWRNFSTELIMWLTLGELIF